MADGINGRTFEKSKVGRKHKQTADKKFSAAERAYIHERDRGCIFCMAEYHMEEINCKESMLQIMHFISRSQGGLGIRQNGALGCVEHHMMFDNGNKGRREEMAGIFRRYLDRYYPGFPDEDRVYNKWRF